MKLTVFGGFSDSNRTQLVIRAAHRASFETPFRKGKIASTALSVSSGETLAVASAAVTAREEVAGNLARGVPDVVNGILGWESVIAVG